MTREVMRRLVAPGGKINLRVMGNEPLVGMIAFYPIGDTLSVTICTEDEILIQGVRDVITAADATELRTACTDLAEWLNDWCGRHVSESMLTALRKASEPASE